MLENLEGVMGASEGFIEESTSVRPAFAEGCLLAVDVGNTVTKFGVFVEDRLMGTWEITTPASCTADEAWAHAARAIDMLDAPEPGFAILSCVVPSLSDVWDIALGKLCGTRPYVVGPGIKTGIRMRYDDPAEVGSDRVADAVAAREAYGAPVVVVDLGTTTNIEVVDESARSRRHHRARVGPGRPVAHVCRRASADDRVACARAGYRPQHACGHAVRCGAGRGGAHRRPP